jgi:hypothetical protein
MDNRLIFLYQLQRANARPGMLRVGYMPARTELEG